MFDPDLYRDPAEIERWKERDPIDTLGRWLVDQEMLTDADVDALWERARSETEQAVSAADAGPLEPLDGLLDHVTTPRTATSPTGAR
jgi:pyruvate dehydrogenase E1 component alpha subunit